jgi:hypothetical protein
VIDRRSVFVAICLFAALAAAQTSVADQPNAERDEVGVMPCPTHSTDPADQPAPAPSHLMCHYRIRLLPVASFPQIPAAVANELDARGCMVPQTYEANGPENVISGSFEKQGSDDWAALCSVRGVTTFYVFFQSNLTHPIALRHQPDNQWLGVEPSFAYGSAWGILPIPPRAVPRTYQMDHDGIEDAFVERSSVIHYYSHGHWTTFKGDD